LERANTFESLLALEKIPFERSNPEEDEKVLYMFAVEKKFFKKTQRLNFLTESKHKKFLISNNYLRYTFVLIMIGAVLIGTFGYCESRKHLKKEEERIEQNTKNLEYLQTTTEIQPS
jgi:hypothetical protein